MIDSEADRARDGPSRAAGAGSSFGDRPGLSGRRDFSCLPGGILMRNRRIAAGMALIFAGLATSSGAAEGRKSCGRP